MAHRFGEFFAERCAQRDTRVTALDAPPVLVAPVATVAHAVIHLQVGARGVGG